MSESPTTPQDPFSDELLVELLVGSRLASMEQIAEARARVSAGGTNPGIPHTYAFAPDPIATGLVAIDPNTLEIAERIVLGDAPAPSDLGEWPAATSGDVLILSPKEGSLVGAVTASHSRTLGLIPTPRGGFFFMGVPPTNPDSPRLATLLAPVMAPSAPKTHPLDLGVSPGGEFVVAANRGAGTVHVVVANTCQQAGAIMLRAAGSRRAIGMAVDRKSAYLTDGMTPRLTILDLVALKVRHQPFPTGPLGPVALTPDGSHLLIVFYKAGDELGLLTVSVADLRVRHLMNLPAHKFAEGPGEAIVVSPDGSLAYILAADDAGAPRLFVVDVPKRKLSAEIPLLGLPLGLAFPPPPDWLPPRPTLEDMVVQMGIATREEIRALQMPEDEVSPLWDPGINPLIVSQLPERLIRSMGMVPMMRDATHLSVAMINPRDAACQQLALQLAGGLQLRLIPIEVEELERFMTERYPTLMASFQAMKNATPVTRSEGGPAPGGPAPGGPMPGGPRPSGPSPGGPMPGGPQPGGPAPTRPAAAPQPTPTPGPQPGGPRPGPAPAPQPTPAAETPAPKPVPAPAPRSVEAAPAAPAALAGPAAPSVETLVSGNGRRVILIENLKRRLTEVDRDRPDVWTFKDIVAGSACYLPNQRMLVSDTSANRIVEIDPLSSQIVWTYGDGGRGLRGPRWAGRLSNGNTLVVDTGNHRILEVTTAGQQVWTHGEAGRAGCTGHGLFKPHAAVRTADGTTLIADSGNHRVIEVDPKGAIVWQYGNQNNRLGGNQGSGPNQLSEPSWASRTPDGTTLVADTGNGRVVEIDPAKTVVWQYRAPLAKGGTPIKDPFAATRLANGNTLVLGRQGVIEVDAELNIVWEHHVVTTTASTAPLPATGPLPAAGPLEMLRQASGPELTKRVEAAPQTHLGSELPANFPDSFMLADRTGGRVVEIDRKMQIFWQFSGFSGGAGNRLVAPNYVTRLPNGGTLIADTGNHRVIEVRDQSIVWQFGKSGEAGGGPRHVSQPRSAERTPQGTMLIADFGNRRVIEVTVAGEVRWGREGFKGPCYASRLSSGNTLVTDWADHQVLEIDAKGAVVWSYGQSGYSGSGDNQLFHPEHAVRLENGHTLISDTQNHRVIEVDAERRIVWQYGGAPEYLGRKGRFGMQFNTPVYAWRLPEGTTVVTHAGKNHVIELDAELNILWHFTLAPDRR